MRGVRITVFAAIYAAPALAAPASAGNWSPYMHDAEVYAKQRRGSVAISVRTPTHEWGWRAQRTFRSASLLKPMLMLAYLDRPGVRDRVLTHADKELLRPMITRSDSAAATRILGIVGTSGLARVARRAGMRRFTPVTPFWGHSRITAADQSRFFLRIERLLPARHRAYALSLLHDIVPSQRWGIARIRPPGWKLYFKGAWGDGDGAVDHQVALLTRGDERVAVAILSADDGTHAYGKETLRGIARRLLRGLATSPADL